MKLFTNFNGDDGLVYTLAGYITTQIIFFLNGHMEAGEEYAGFIMVVCAFPWLTLLVVKGMWKIYKGMSEK